MTSLALASAAALVCAPSPACAQEAPAPRVSPQKAIGVVLPLSGKHKRLGQAVLDALNLALEGEEGVELVVGDSGGRAEVAAREVERLAGDPRVAAIVGPVGWKESRAAAERAQALGMPIVTLSAEQGMEDIGSYVFRARVSVQEQARYMGKMSVDELQVERYAILYPDDALGRASAEVFFEAVRLGGGRVTAMASYKRGDTNMTHAVEELVGMRGPKLAGRKASRSPSVRRRDKWDKSPHVNFDALFVPDYDDAVVLLTKFLRFVDVPLAGLGDGSSVQMLGIDHLVGPHLSDAEGMLTGALCSATFDVNSGETFAVDFVKAYREAFKRDPTTLDAQARDRLLHVVAALSRVPVGTEPDATRERVRVGLVSLKPWVGLTGKQWFLPSGAPGQDIKLYVVDTAGGVSPSLP